MKKENLEGRKEKFGRTTTTRIPPTTYNTITTNNNTNLKRPNTDKPLKYEPKRQRLSTITNHHTTHNLLMNKATKTRTITDISIPIQTLHHRTSKQIDTH